MDPNWLSVAVAAGIPTAIALIGYGMLRQKVVEQGTDLTDLKEVHRDAIRELKDRVMKAEDAAVRVTGLAGAVEAMGQRFADQIKNLVTVMDLHNTNTRDQLADIKADIQTVRSGRQAKETPPPRRRGASN